MSNHSLNVACGPLFPPLFSSYLFYLVCMVGVRLKIPDEHSDQDDDWIQGVLSIEQSVGLVSKNIEDKKYEYQF